MSTRARTYIYVERMQKQITDWVLQNGLDPEFSARYPEHDAIHIVYGLSTVEEGIVLAIETWAEMEKIQGLVEPQDYLFFEELCKALSLDTDVLSRDTMRRVFDRLIQEGPPVIIWPYAEARAREYAQTHALRA